MFVLKSTYLQCEARIKEQAMLYESRISDLHKQIQDLRTMVFSPKDSTNPSAVALEMDAVLSQKEEVMTVTAEQMAEFEEIESEANRILSGNY